MEIFNKDISDYFKCDFVQDNFVKTTKIRYKRNAFSKKRSSSKIDQVFKGKILDVAVDLRKKSPTYKNGLAEFYLMKILNIFIPVVLSSLFMPYQKIQRFIINVVAIIIKNLMQVFCGQILI